VPPAKRAGSQSRSTTRKTTSRAQPKRRTTSSSGGRARSTRSTSASARSRTRAASPEAQLEAAAERLRKLNERIIEAAKDAGETTLTNYEKALKSIASAVERGPGKSDVEWISNLATAQAKFIRDVTESWTKAARKVLK
jgi:hypothetical protein